MLNTKSDYAMNKKDSHAIVYLTADGNITRLTSRDFSSEEEFWHWKALSDADYHLTEKDEHIYANHTVSIDELSEKAAVVPGADSLFEAEYERQKQMEQYTTQLVKIRTHLNEVQFQRLWLKFVEELSLEEIASRDGVSHQAVSLTICTAKRKIKNIFGNDQNSLAKLPANRR